MSRKPNITCEGTRYHKVCIAHGENMLMCVVSTPLTEEELSSFIHARIGFPRVLESKEVPQDEAESPLNGRILGLSAFENLLKPFVPEEILKEKILKMVMTNKTHGDFRVESIEEREV